MALFSWNAFRKAPFYDYQYIGRSLFSTTAVSLPCSKHIIKVVLRKMVDHALINFVKKGRENMIPPHGGILIQKLTDELQKDELLSKMKTTVQISDESLADLELIANGAYSPLDGFMDKENYLHVLKNMRLKNGLVWSLPITLAVTKEKANECDLGTLIGLKGKDGKTYGVLELTEKYGYDKKEEAKLVYGTTDKNHPGVKKLYSKGDVYLAGPIHLINNPSHSPFEDYVLSPLKTRKLFSQLNWNTVVGFQTRNPIHRAHEYIQKCALESTDGLFLHPLIGETKKDDIPADIRIESYNTLLKHYYPDNRVKLAAFPAAMRYAGPREAIFHALVRKNYGCTHFIIGRDHAGVGDYYGTYEAQEIFNQFSTDEINITILKFDHAYFCKICNSMSTIKTCPHHSNHHLHLSGTKVREMLRQGKKPPKEFTRPEVAEVLIKGLNKR